MPRPGKSLLAHILDGTFRADRHGHLLAGKLLPKRSPYPDARRAWIWDQLRERQVKYRQRDAGDDDGRELDAEIVSKCARALNHPWKWPTWVRPPEQIRERMEREPGTRFDELLDRALGRGS